jgi:hypothetical protein
VRGRGGDNDGRSDEELDDDSSGGRAGQAEPISAALSPCNRRGARGRGGGDDGHDAEELSDSSSGGLAGQAEPL